MKRKRLFSLVTVCMLLLLSDRTVCASCAEEKGVIRSETGLYAAADYEADELGKIGPGTKVDVLSVLSEFVLIKENGRYAYVPCESLYIDADYEKHYGKKKACGSTHPVLVTEGRLFENAVETLLLAYHRIPERIREAFEAGGFRIKMTEWDVAEEAYAPYGGYRGIGRIKAVTDYERKMIYVNDEWPNAIIHEMGHFLNDFLGMYSSRPGKQGDFPAGSGKDKPLRREQRQGVFRGGLPAVCHRTGTAWPDIAGKLRDGGEGGVFHCIRPWKMLEYG